MNELIRLLNMRSVGNVNSIVWRLAFRQETSGLGKSGSRQNVVANIKFDVTSYWRSKHCLGLYVKYSLINNFLVFKQNTMNLP